MSLIEHAKREFEILGWPGDCEMQDMVCKNVLELIETFSGQGHSGSSAPYVMNLFRKLAMWKTIAPLTGEDDEWNHVEGDTYQNRRNSAVFKEGKDGQAYWLYGKVFRDPDGVTWTGKGSRTPIEFPWTEPEKSEIVDVDEDGSPVDVKG